MNDADDWRAKRARYERFIATELGRLYRAYDHATIEYWKNDGNDSISDRKLEQLDNAVREAADAFVAKLMELAGT